MFWGFALGAARLGPGRPGRLPAWHTPGMSEDPVCAFCGKLIGPKDSKVTIQGGAYHSRCWERKARGQRA